MDVEEEEEHTIKLNRHSLELDLDYLDKPSEGSCFPHSPTSLSHGSPDDPELVKLVLLGAPGVGKTSIIQQFVWNSFSSLYSTTSCRHTYYPTVIVNRRVYELKITDLPALPYFPVHDLTDCPGSGLRDATAYLMVLDLSEPSTFHYLETVRRQIAECRDIRAVPLLVVGNKVDLFDGEDEDLVSRRRSIMDRVRTDWGSHYVDCSARHGSTVCHVFRKLLETLAPDRPHVCQSVIDYTISGAKCSFI